MRLLGFLTKCGPKNRFKKTEGNLYGFKSHRGVNLNLSGGDFYHAEKHKPRDSLVNSADL